MNKVTRPNRHANAGFTLTELAVALVIVALLLAGSMIPLSAQIEIRNIADTRRTMDTIKDAIVGFAQANGRLPCPADGTLNVGTEQITAGQCSSAAGVIPWSTLGVPETDAWGRRFSYYVVPTFADDYTMLTWSTAGQSPACVPSPTPAQPTSFALCTLGNLTVNTRNGSHAATSTGSALAAVIISHGKNGHGAYTPGSGQVSSPAAGTDEAANASHLAATTVFYSRDPTQSASGCSDTATGSPFCEFDDIVTAIPATWLMSRMVSAGRLP